MLSNVKISRNKWEEDKSKGIRWDSLAHYKIRKDKRWKDVKLYGMKEKSLRNKKNRIKEKRSIWKRNSEQIKKLNKNIWGWKLKGVKWK